MKKITLALMALALLFSFSSCKKDVEKVEVTPATLALQVGETAELKATVTPDQAEYTLAWTSSNTAIATVDNSGKVTAVAEGTVTITAEAGGQKGTCTVTITPSIESLSIDPTTLTVLVGNTASISATVVPATAASGIVWSSNNTTVATVANGTVTGIAEGTATITAAVGGKTATCAVTVVQMQDGVNVTFGDLNWTAGAVSAGEYASYGMLQIKAAKEPSGESFPILDVVTPNQQGNSTISNETGYVEYYEEYSLSGGGYTYGDWWAIDQDGSYYGDGTPQINITAIGNGTVSGNFTVTMFSALQKYTDIGDGQIHTRDLTVVFQNVSYESVAKALKSITHPKNRNINVSKLKAVRK